MKINLNHAFCISFFQCCIEVREIIKAIVSRKRTMAQPRWENMATVSEGQGLRVENEKYTLARSSS